MPGTGKSRRPAGPQPGREKAPSSPFRQQLHQTLKGGIGAHQQRQHHRQHGDGDSQTGNGGTAPFSGGSGIFSGILQTPEGSAHAAEAHGEQAPGTVKNGGKAALVPAVLPGCQTVAEIHRENQQHGHDRLDHGIGRPGKTGGDGGGQEQQRCAVPAEPVAIPLQIPGVADQNAQTEQGEAQIQPAVENAVPKPYGKNQKTDSEAEFLFFQGVAGWG